MKIEVVIGTEGKKGDIVSFSKEEKEDVFILAENKDSNEIIAVNLSEGILKYSISIERTYKELIDHVYICGEYDGYELYDNNSVKLTLDNKSR